MIFIIVPSLICTIFLLVGLSLMAIHVYYRMHARELPGKIIAAEKYESMSQSKGSRTFQTYYRPICEYYFLGERVWFVGAGREKLPHRIGESITVLSLDRGPNFCRLKNNDELLFGIIFFIISLIPLGIVVYKSENLTTTFSILGSIVALVLGLAIYLHSKNLFGKIMEVMLRQSELETESTLADRQIFWDQNQLETEHKSLNNAGFLISLIFCGILASILKLLWQKIPTKNQVELISCLDQTCTITDLQRFFENKNVVGLAIVGMLLLIGLFSLVSTFMKLLKRR